MGQGSCPDIPGLTKPFRTGSDPLVWIREGDILIIVPLSFQEERCNIIYRYTGPRVEWLKRNRYL